MGFGFLLVMSLSLYIFLFSSYILCGVIGAFLLRKHEPRHLMIWSVGFIIYSAVPSSMMLIDSRTLDNKFLELVGQSLLVFFSIVGGALFNSAWSELRVECRSNSNNH